MKSRIHTVNQKKQQQQKMDEEGKLWNMIRIYLLIKSFTNKEIVTSEYKIKKILPA